MFAVAPQLSNILADLGNIPSERVRVDPKPGSVTVNDLIRVNAGEGRYESICAVIHLTRLDPPMPITDNTVDE